MGATCIHCNGWGCVRCGEPVRVRLGEQCDAELLEIDTRVAAAVKAEREACARDVEEMPHFTRHGNRPDNADYAALIRARGVANG